ARETKFANLAPTVYSFPKEISPERFSAHPEIEQLTQPRRKTSKKHLLWPLVAIFVLAAIALPAGIAVWTLGYRVAENRRADSSPNSPANSIANSEKENSIKEEKLSYFLLVQKMRNGKPFEEPFKSSGREIFESGYK